MQTIHIKATTGTGDCEDCGFYDYGHFEITFEDGTMITGSYDGHLGGGPWDGTMRTLYHWCLAKLGYAVEVEGMLHPVPLLYRYNIEPEYGTTTIVLFDGTPEVLALKTAQLSYPDYPEHTYIAAVQLPAVGNEGPVVLADVKTPEGLLAGRRVDWDGEDHSIYRTLLEQRCILTVEEHHEPDDEFGDDPDYGDSEDE